MAISIANAFMNSVRYELNDNGATKQWSDTELLGYYNLFRTAVLSEYPNALTKPATFNCAAGVDQVLAADGVTYIRVPSNASGEGISQVSAEAMYDADPNWYGAPPTKIVEHVIPDPKDTLRFRVYPPNDGTGVLNISYGYDVTDATAVTDNFGLTEAYRMAAFHCVLACALFKNTPRQDIAKSQMHFGLFDQKIAARVQAEVVTKTVAGAPQPVQVTATSSE